MTPARLPENEAKRLESLRSYSVLDTPPEKVFDEITALAAHICKTPMSLVSLIDQDRQWFKSKFGLDAPETNRDSSFCGHAILQPDVFIVPDSLKDQRFKDNPLVRGDPNVRFYAGVPLVMPDDFSLGTLCVIDNVPRTLSVEQLDALKLLGKNVCAQLELRRKNLDLKESLENLELANRNLEEVGALKSYFVSMVSHELRTPMTSIRLSLGALRDGFGGELTPEAKSLVGIAIAGTERLIRLVDDILDVDKMESGNMTFQYQVLEIAPLIERSLIENEPYAQKHQVRFEFKDIIHGVRVKIDPDRFAQILDNLLSNAAKYSDDGDEIQVKMSRHGNRVRVSVIDHGPGIPESFRDRVFGKFMQAEGRKRGKKGTGLGLTICKALVEQQGGSIDFDSKEGKGSTFYFEFPIQESAGESV